MRRRRRAREALNSTPCWQSCECRVSCRGPQVSCSTPPSLNGPLSSLQTAALHVNRSGGVGLLKVVERAPSACSWRSWGLDQRLTPTEFGLKASSSSSSFGVKQALFGHRPKKIDHRDSTTLMKCDAK